MIDDYLDRLHIRNLNESPSHFLEWIGLGYFNFEVEEVSDLDDFEFRYKHFGQLESIVIGEHIYNGSQEYYTIIRGRVELNYLLNLAKYGKVRLDKISGKIITFYKEELYWDLIKNIKI